MEVAATSGRNPQRDPNLNSGGIATPRFLLRYERQRLLENVPLSALSEPYVENGKRARVLLYVAAGRSVF
jgi:hypothetical protein